MDFYKTELTRQSLSDDRYLELLGISNWTFQSNIGFIIEMIDKEHHNHSNISWFKLIDVTSGQLKSSCKDEIKSNIGDEAFKLFTDLVKRRNQIIHGLPTEKLHNSHPIMVYRSSSNRTTESVDITDEFLKEFIVDNSTLSHLIHKARGY